MSDETVEQVAVALAQRRVPQSTVYMDGSHNPTPMDYLTAEELVSVIRADERRRALYEAGQENPSMAAQAKSYEQGHRDAVAWLLTDDAASWLLDRIGRDEFDDYDAKFLMSGLHYRITGVE